MNCIYAYVRITLFSICVSNYAFEAIFVRLHNLSVCVFCSIYLLYYIVVYTFAKQLNDDDDNEDRIVFMC